MKIICVRGWTCTLNISDLKITDLGYINRVNVFIIKTITSNQNLIKMAHTIERETNNFRRMPYGDDNGQIANVTVRSNILQIPGTYEN